MGGERGRREHATVTSWMTGESATYSVICVAKQETRARAMQVRVGCIWRARWMSGGL